MSAWKSRWSWVRLVKSATSKWIASARCRVSACEETSIAQAPSPRVEHPPEGRLQVDRLRRRPHDLLLDPADHLLHRPEQPALDAGRLEDLADQEGGGRLAVGPGDPDDPQLAPSDRPRTAPPAAPSPPARRRPPPAAPRLAAPARPPAPPPRPRPRPAEVVPVDLLPGHAEEQRPGPDLAAVVGELSNPNRAVAILGYPSQFDSLLAKLLKISRSPDASSKAGPRHSVKRPLAALAGGCLRPELSVPLIRALAERSWVV